MRNKRVVNSRENDPSNDHIIYELCYITTNQQHYCVIYKTQRFIYITRIQQYIKSMHLINKIYQFLNLNATLSANVYPFSPRRHALQTVLARESTASIPLYHTGQGLYKLVGCFSRSSGYTASESTDAFLAQDLSRASSESRRSISLLGREK